jgi:hypothetical protein
MSAELNLPAISLPLGATTLAQIKAFGERHHVARLWLFGSILRSDFSADSDVDMLIEFERGFVPGWEYLELQAELSAIFGRAVDLGMPDAIPMSRRAQIMQTAQVIYERA